MWKVLMFLLIPLYMTGADWNKKTEKAVRNE